MDLPEVIWEYGLELSSVREGQVAGSCESGNEHLSFIKFGEFLD
jgi:hypothetical protein